VIVYFDTSALMKLVVDEAGSHHAAELWDTADLVVASRLAYPEARAALAAATRAERLTETGHRTVKSEFARIWQQIGVVEVSATICATAGDLAERHSLRGYDAVHLASAMAASKADLMLATWDRDLGSAALTVGIPVAPDPTAP
jgi:predicted nucleic acid-binding protein